MLPLTAQRFPAETAKVLDELLVLAMHEAGRHQVISTADISAMLEAERVKDIVGCETTACAVEIGGALGVRYIAFGSVSQLGNKVIVTLQLIDSENAQVVSRAAANVLNNEDNFARAVRLAVQRLYGIETTEPPPRVPKPREFEVELGDVGTRVSFATEPPGSVVLLDGEFLCQRTPCSKFVPPGTHELRLFEDDACHLPQKTTIEVLDQREQEVVFVGEQRLAGIRVFLSDSEGNDLAGNASVDNEPLGAVPGAYRVFACAREIELVAEDGKRWQGKLELEAETVQEVHGIIAPDAQAPEPPEPKPELGMYVGTAVALETYEQVVTDGETVSIPTERVLAGQLHGAVTYGLYKYGVIVPYSAPQDGHLPKGVGDVSVYARKRENGVTWAGWLRLPHAERGYVTAQDAGLGLTELGTKLVVDGSSEFFTGIGITYARKFADTYEGYRRWRLLLDGGIQAFDTVTLYLRSLIPLGSDSRDVILDRVGAYVDSGVVARYRFVVTKWLAATAEVELRFSFNNPPDPEDAPDELKTPSRLALTAMPTLSADIFHVVTLRVRLARFRRFGVPWGTDLYEGFALSQNNGIKAAPVPVMIEIAVRI